jgi:DNA-binding beta-propeller fold protein YncE
MFRKTLPMLAVYLLFTISVYAQEEKPTIYLCFSDDIIKIIDAMSLEEIGEIQTNTIPSFIELNSDKSTAFISSPLSFSTGLSIVDLIGRREIGKLFPNEVVNRARIGPDGFVYVLLNESRQIVLLNAQTFQLEGRIQFSSSPLSIIFSPNGTRAYVICRVATIQNQLFVVDTQNRSIITSIPITNLFVGTENEQLAITPDGNTLYVGREARGTGRLEAVAIVDTLRLSVAGLLPIEGIGARLRVSPDGRTLYVIHANSNFVQFLTMVSLPSNTIIRTTQLESSGPITLSPDGRLFYLSLSRRGLLVFDANTSKLVARRDYNVFLGETKLIGNFSLGTSPTIQVLSPQTGETIQRGQPFTIRWQTTSGGFKPGFHQIDLSTDGGTTFNILAKDLPGDDQQFTFNVPSFNVPVPTSPKAQIRISVVDAGARSASALSGVFTIGDRTEPPPDNQPPTVRFISPIGGEQFSSGSSLMINWSSSDNVAVSSQDLALSIDGGATFNTSIATGLSGTVQSLTFQIPDNLQTQRARLRLIVKDSAGNSAQTITPADFQIQSAADTQSPTVTISRPAGDILPAGQPITVNWQSRDNVTVVSQSLLLSLDGGSSFQTIANFGSDASSFTLNNLPGLDRTTARAQVKITASDAAGNKGEQTAGFTLAPAITQASFAKPTLTITGIGFTSSNTQAAVTVFINNQAIAASRVTINENTTITLRGNKKKLNLVKGNNTVRVVIDGIGSNTTSFSF